MPSTINCGRGLMGFLQPLTGECATGTVFVVPPAGTIEPQSIPPNTFMIPVARGDVRPDQPFRVLPNFDDTIAGAWEIPPEGASIPVQSLVGGLKQNVPAGSTMRWADDIPVGFDITGGIVDSGGLVGATAAPAYGTDLLSSVTFFESLGTPTMDLEAFRANVSRFPACVVIWEGGSKSPTAMGRGKTLFLERWNLLLITGKATGDAGRRGEGLRLLDSMEDLLTWQTIFPTEDQAFGVIVSAVASTDVTDRYRLTGKTEAYQNVYVYGLRLSTKRVVDKVAFRTFANWNKTRLQAENPDTNAPTDPNPLKMADDTFDMPQS